MRCARLVLTQSETEGQELRGKSNLNRKGGNGRRGDHPRPLYDLRGRLSEEQHLLRLCEVSCF